MSDEAVVVDSTPAADVAAPSPESTPSAPAGETAALPETEQAASTANRAKDPTTGRFVAKSADVTPEPTGETPATADTPPEVTPAPAVGEPYTYQARGNPQAIEGAVRIPGEGLRIPEASIPRVEQILRTAHEYAPVRKERDELKSRIPALEKQATERTAYNEQVGSRYLEIAHMISTDPERAFEELKEFGQALPELRLKYREREIEERARQLEDARAPRPEDVRAQQEEELTSTFNTWLADAQRDPSAKDMTSEDWRDFDDYVDTLWPNLRGKAPDGREVFRSDLLAKWIIQRNNRSVAHKAALKKAAEDAAFNAKQLNKPNNTPPPGAKGGADGKVVKNEPSITNRRELDRWMNS